MRKQRFSPAAAALRLLILLLGSCVMLYPFVYMILSSFKFNPEILRTPHLLPGDLHHG